MRPEPQQLAIEKRIGRVKQQWHEKSSPKLRNEEMKDQDDEKAKTTVTISNVVEVVPNSLLQ